MMKTVKTVLSLVLVIAVVLALFACGKKEKAGSNPDDADIGEIYYQETPAEHIASTEAGVMYADNELLVVAKDGVKKSEIEQLAEKYDAKIVGYIEKTGDYQWQLSKTYPKEELESILAQIGDETDIDSASLNYIFDYSSSSVGNINIGEKWNKDLEDSIDNKGKSWGVEAINAPDAWKMMDEHKSEIEPVRIGVIDAGFDVDHEDIPFAPNQTFYNENFKEDYENAKSKKEILEANHGTHVTGTFAANGNNNIGICGVYPYADQGGLTVACFNNYRMFSENRVGTTINEKICFASLILRGAKVINCSYINEQMKGVKLAYYQEKSNESEYAQREILQANCDLDNSANILANFLQRLIDKKYDFIIVTASGNTSNDNFEISVKVEEYYKKINYNTKDIPADTVSHLARIPRLKTDAYSQYIECDYEDVYDRIIVVGAIDKKYNRCDFSNNGNRVDVYAPGKRIFSTIPDNKYENGNFQFNWNGTSQAAPHVAGIAASMWSINNKLTGPLIKELIKATVSVQHDNLPIVDMKLAVKAALNTIKNNYKEPIEPGKGAIMGFVVDKDRLIVSSDDGILKGEIKNATVTAINIDTKEKNNTTTSSSGHFELILPPGKYKINVDAEGYISEIGSKDIEVREGEVTYLDDWIKLEKIKDNTSKTQDYLLKYIFDGSVQSTNLFEFFDNGSCKMYTNDSKPAEIKSRDELKEIGTLTYRVEEYKISVSGKGYNYELEMLLKEDCTECYQHPQYAPSFNKLKEAKYAFYETSWSEENDPLEGPAYMVPVIRKTDLISSDSGTSSTSLPERETRTTVPGDRATTKVDYRRPAGYPAEGQKYWVIFEEGFRSDRVELSTFDVIGDDSSVYGIWDGNLYAESDTGEIDGYNQFHYDDGWVYDRNYGVLTDKTHKIIAANFDIYDDDGNLMVPASDNFICIPYDAVCSDDGHYYKVYPEGTVSSYEKAKAFCEKNGGYLAVISSDDENEFLYEYITDEEIYTAYFGYSDSEKEGSWKWTGGEKSGYTNWHSGEPDSENSNEDYAEFYWKFDDGTWNDGDFGNNTVSDSSAFICEWAPDYVED